MSASPINGNGAEWATAFTAFHERHKGKDGKKLKFTGVFNSHMEAFMMEPEVDLDWRVLAWIWRYSWGNNSDFAVDKIGGDRLGQQECADALAVDKRRVSDALIFLRALNFVAPDTGHKLYPVDDPLAVPQKTDNSGDSKVRPLADFQAFCDEWKVRSLADFQKLQSAEDMVKRLKIVRLGQFREWKRARTSGDPSLIQLFQPISTVPPSVGPVPLSEEEAPPAPPLERPTDRPKEGLEGNPFKPKISKFLEGRVPGFALEEPELAEIAATIQTETHFQQFKEAADLQKKPRGYRVFVKIARECEALHSKYATATAGGGGGSQEESYWERRARRRQSKEGNANG